MKVKIKVPNELESVLPEIGNKTKQKALLKVYNALTLKSKYKNKEGYLLNTYLKLMVDIIL